MNNSQPKSLRTCLLEFLKAKKRGKPVETDFGSFDVAIKILPDHALICDKTDQKYFKSKHLFAKLLALSEMGEDLKLKDLESFKFCIEEVSFILDPTNPSLEYNKFLDIDFNKIGAKEDRSDLSDYRFEFDMVQEDNRVNNEADAAIKYCKEHPSENSLVSPIATQALRRSPESQYQTNPGFEEDLDQEVRGHSTLQHTLPTIDSQTHSNIEVDNSQANEPATDFSGNKVVRAPGAVISLDETSVSSILPGVPNLQVTPQPGAQGVSIATKIQPTKRSLIEPDFSDESDQDMTMRTTATKKGLPQKEKDFDQQRTRKIQESKREYRDSSSEMEDVRGNKTIGETSKKPEKIIEEKSRIVHESDKHTKAPKEIPPILGDYAAQQLHLAQLLNSRKDLGLYYPELASNALYSSLLLPSLAFGNPADLYRLNPALFLGKRNPLEDQLIQDYQRLAKAPESVPVSKPKVPETAAKTIKEPTRSVSPMIDGHAGAGKAGHAENSIRVAIEKVPGTSTYISSLLKKLKGSGVLERNRAGLYEDLKDYKQRLKQLESTRATNIQTLAKQFVQGDYDYQSDAQQLTSLVLESVVREIEVREKNLTDIEARVKESDASEAELKKDFEILSAEKTELTSRVDKIIKKSERIRDAIKDCSSRLESEKKAKDEAKEQLRVQKAQTEEVIAHHVKLKAFLKQTAKTMGEHSRDMALEPSTHKSEYDTDHRDRRYHQSSTAGREKSQAGRTSNRRDEDERSKKNVRSKYYGEDSDDERANEKTLKSTTRDGAYSKRGADYDERSNKQDQQRARELLLKKKLEMQNGTKIYEREPTRQAGSTRYKSKREHDSSNSESDSYDESPEPRHK